MLKERFITAVIALLALAIVLFVLPFDVAVLVLMALILAGAWEWSGFLGAGGLAPRLAYVAVVVAAIVATGLWMQNGDLLHLMLLACGWWLFAFGWAFFFPTPIAKPLRWLAGLLVLVPTLFALAAALEIGSHVVLYLLAIVWAADMGAYFAGKRFGRVKLAPSISPGKTWEGVAGGLIAVTVLAVAAGSYRGLALPPLVLFSLVVAAVSVVGDLTVSMFKRTAGLKDSGKLFPGHGGVLDRIDSVSAAAPVFMIGLGMLDFNP